MFFFWKFSFCLEKQRERYEENERTKWKKSLNWTTHRNTHVKLLTFWQQSYIYMPNIDSTTFLTSLLSFVFFCVWCNWSFSPRKKENRLRWRKKINKRKPNTMKHQQNGMHHQISGKSYFLFSAEFFFSIHFYGCSKYIRIGIRFFFLLQ